VARVLALHRTLIAYRNGDAAMPATLELVQEARSANKRVPSLAGTKATREFNERLYNDW
jgi:hypothetical protein